MTIYRYYLHVPCVYLFFKNVKKLDTFTNTEKSDKSERMPLLQMPPNSILLQEIYLFMPCFVVCEHVFIDCYFMYYYGIYYGDTTGRLLY